MSRLEELMAELCPDGVEYKTLGEFATISRGGSFQKKDFLDDGFPCIHYGQIYTQYGLFADKTLKFISPSVAKKQKKVVKNDIVMAVTSENIEDVCKCLAWLGEDEVAVSGHTAIIHHNQNPKYLTYYFHSEMFAAQKRRLAHGTKVMEVTPNKLNDVKIPLPPLEVQREIVRILDSFTELDAELNAELDARKKQYEYYRDDLLTFTENHPFAELCPDEVEYKKLSEITVISRGVRVVKKQLSEEAEGLYPVYQNCMTPLGYFAKSNCPADTTFIISAGAAGEIGYSESAFWAADDCCYFKCPETLSSKYLYYALQCQQHIINSKVRYASVPRLPQPDVEKLKIPLPPLDVQEKIVSILDRFGKLCNDISVGIPAEIEARRKQYEHYRDQLLTFEKKTA